MIHHIILHILVAVIINIISVLPHQISLIINVKRLIIVQGINNKQGFIDTRKVIHMDFCYLIIYPQRFSRSCEKPSHNFRVVEILADLVIDLCPYLACKYDLIFLHHHIFSFYCPVNKSHRILFIFTEPA